MQRASDEKETEKGKLKQLHSSALYIGVKSPKSQSLNLQFHAILVTKPKEVNENSIQC